ncbi:hypothetical protein [Kitasatospora albolonga]
MFQTPAEQPASPIATSVLYLQERRRLRCSSVRTSTGATSPR